MTTPFTFDGMTPVMIGVDEDTVKYYKEMMEENLEQEIQIYPGLAIKLRDLIPAIHNGIGTQRWSHRDLPRAKVEV